MTILRTKHITSCLTILLGVTSVAHAHHEGIWHSFRVATEISDYRELRPIFTVEAWEGEAGTVAGKKLNEMARSAAEVEFNPGARMESRERGVMALIFTGKDGKRTWVYIWFKPLKQKVKVPIAGRGFGCNWHVVKLATDRNEVKRLLPNTLKLMERTAKKGDADVSSRVIKGSNGANVKTTGR